MPLKESWLYYDYLRRWWRLLLVGSLIGGLASLAYYYNQVHPPEHTATATVAIESPETKPDVPPPPVLITIDSGAYATPEAAVRNVESIVAKIAGYATPRW